MRNVAIALGAALAVALLWLASSAVYSLGESEKALVVRLGSPSGIVSAPGLHLRVPIVDSVIVYDTRLLALEGRPEQIILGDQKRVDVQIYARYRVSDPLAFYRALRSVEGGRSQLLQIVSSAARRELGRVRLNALLSSDRADVMETIRREVAARSAAFGVEIVDVRLRRADLPAETSQAVYARMKSERQREAKELRAQGFEWAQAIQAGADRERTALLAEATKRSRIVRGEGDARCEHALRHRHAAIARVLRLLPLAADLRAGPVRRPAGAVPVARRPLPRPAQGRPASR